MNAIKYDHGKDQFSLLPSDALRAVVRVFMYGAAKYSAHNYVRGMNWTRIADAMLRHVFAWLEGEDNDLESGHSHLAHGVCCGLMLLVLVLRGKGTDDRFVIQSASEAVETESASTPPSASPPSPGKSASGTTVECLPASRLVSVQPMLGIESAR